VSRPAAFLDRDGTVIEERGYIDRLDMVTLFPWTSDALRLLNRAGFAVVVITNQAAVGRGIIDEAFVETVHREIDRRIEPAGASIDRYYYCPHFPDSKIPRYRQVCGCRKPAPGLIEQAVLDLDLDRSRSVMVGDRWIDMACAQAARTRGVLVRTGHGAREADVPPEGAHADAILNNLMEAVGWILRNSSRW